MKNNEQIQVPVCVLHSTPTIYRCSGRPRKNTKWYDDCNAMMTLMKILCSGGMTRSDQELLVRFLLQRLLGKTDYREQESVAKIAERAAFDDLLSSASVVYPEVGHRNC